jgi:hypothetical protein
LAFFARRWDRTKEQFNGPGVDAEPLDIWFEFEERSQRRFALAESISERVSGSYTVTGITTNGMPSFPGSLYWFGARDSTGAYLDGGKSYKLTVPHPVPASLFWSPLTIARTSEKTVRSCRRSCGQAGLVELRPKAVELVLVLPMLAHRRRGSQRGQGRWDKANARHNLG